MAALDYLSARTQPRQVYQLSQQEAHAHAVVLEAYTQLAASDFGQVILDDLVTKVLLQPCVNDRDEGKRLLVLEMLTLIKEAANRLPRLRGEGV